MFGSGVIFVGVCVTLARAWTHPVPATSQEIPQDVHVGMAAGLPSVIHLSGQERDAFLRILEDRLNSMKSLGYPDAGAERSNTPQPDQYPVMMTVNDEPEPGNYVKGKRDAARFGPNIGPFMTTRMSDAWANRGVASSYQAPAETEMTKTEAWKRKVSGKLCYINPIACFGRRQRETVS